MADIIANATYKDYIRWKLNGFPKIMTPIQIEDVIKRFQVTLINKPGRKKRIRPLQFEELAGSKQKIEEAALAVKSEEKECNGALEAFDKLTKNSETQRIHDFLLNNSTAGERLFYTDVGAYPTPGGIEQFDIFCQNIRELFIRAREIAKEKHFKVELGTDKRANDLKVVCKYKSPYDLNCVARKRFCSFFVRYRFDEKAGYFLMIDYDELHTHPVNENWKNALVLQN